jgi:glycosyltransferase involved in cell wall biosynthesis
MAIALVMTVKDEVALLRSNLLYHRHLGVEYCYVFDDGSTDGTAGSVADLPFVEVRATTDAARFEGRADLEDTLRPHPYQSRRQALNCAWALDLARAAGVDWLVHVDADELLCPDLDDASAGALARHLERVEASIEMVVFTVVEAIQRGLSDEEAFGATLFRRPGTKLERPALDPSTNETWPVARYGHAQGKAAVRVALDTRPDTPHRFVRRDGSPLNERLSGYVAHYYGYNAEDFWNKFKRTALQGDRYPLGEPVQRRVRVWHDMAHDPRFSDEDRALYYDRWIRFQDGELRRLQRTRRFGLFAVTSPVLEVTSVRDALRTLGVLDASGPPLA